MDDTTLATSLERALGPGRVLADEPLAAHTTFHVGGPADAFVSARGADDIRAAIACARELNEPWSVLGAGSNVLVADAGLRGLCIHIGADMAQIRIEGNELVAGAGALNADVAEAACAAGLSGYEFACGIPGSIGGAAIMNAGAYDGEFKDVCASVTCLALDGSVLEVDAEQASWGYRHSMMMDAGYIVLSARLVLVPFDGRRIRARMDELTAAREAKQPLELGSAGSTFKRPIGYYAGKLIQDAGMQGHRVGGAMVSDKHAGFVVNAGEASAADVRAVIRDVQNAVFADAGVMLEPEVRMWGFEGE